MIINSMSKAIAELELANNGYTFASNMDEHFIRNAEKAVARGLIFKAMLPGYDGRDALAYLTPRAAKVYKIA